MTKTIRIKKRTINTRKSHRNNRRLKNILMVMLISMAVTCLGFMPTAFAISGEITESENTYNIQPIVPIKHSSNILNLHAMGLSRMTLISVHNDLIEQEKEQELACSFTSIHCEVFEDEAQRLEEEARIQKELEEEAERQRQKAIEEEAKRQQAIKEEEARKKAEEAKANDKTPTYSSFDGNTSVNSYSGLTADDINKILVGTPMEGLGQSIYETEQQWKVNAKFILSVASQESGKGKSSIAQNRKNLFGILIRGKAKTFDSFDACIRDFGRMISQVYFDRGLTTIHTIGPVYCPPKPEIPEHHNNLWQPNMIWFLNSF